MASRDQSMVVRGVSWRDYVILREALDTPGLKLTYCEGVLELMSPSRAHEELKTRVARLLELYGFLFKLPMNGYGSTTFRREAKQRGAEPDECWCVGPAMAEGAFPDIVLEVIQSNPILDKLEVYDGFEVPEVWLIVEGELRVHVRRTEGGYARVSQSPRLPELDLALLMQFASRVDHPTALQDFAAALGRSS
jgi:Uma2 family endonuclease